MTRRKKIRTEPESYIVWSEGPDVEWDDPTFEAVVEANEKISPPEINLDILTEKQRFVIECSFGLGRGELSEREIAALMGISQPSVHRLKEKALRNLRRGVSF